MRLDELLALHERTEADGADSAALPELTMRYDMDVCLILGDEMNFKITIPSNLEMFRVLAEMETRDLKYGKGWLGVLSQLVRCGMCLGLVTGRLLS